ncbi:MAG: transcriptional repressor [Deltaproteobacteria bacterium]|nr:MAG: transcriptional repressor [Deltaproteobacteria bacterium]
MKEVKRRNTRQRNVVLSVLKNTHSHPDAEWIYQEARKIIPNLSLGTVYRNLKILKDQGKIIEIKSEFSPSARYDAEVSPHGHFHCTTCDSIIDVHGVRSGDFIDETVLKGVGKVASFQVVFYGTCASCLSRNS